jgi:hypothetical protein
MSGRTQSRDFCTERANFWNILQEIVHGLRHHYPETRDYLIGRAGHLSLVLSSYQRMGEFLGETFPPSEIVLDAPPGFFTMQAQRHENFFGTEFGYACWSTQAHLSYIVQDLVNDRDPARIADLLEQLVATWQLIEMRVFPYPLPTLHSSRLALALQTSRAPYNSSRIRAAHSNTPVSPGSPGSYESAKTPRSGGPLRSSPRVWFILPPPTNTLHGRARRTRHRPASPYPDRDERRRLRQRSSSPALENEQTLPPLLTNGDALELPASSLPGIQSLLGPEILPDGSVLHGALGIYIPPPDDLPAHFEEPALSTEISILNSYIGETLRGTRPPSHRAPSFPDSDYRSPGSLGEYED